MQIIRWAAAAQIIAGNDVALPANAPRLSAVIGAEITRPSQGLAAHLAAAVIAGVADHAAALVAGGVVDHAAALVIDGVTTHLTADVVTAMGAYLDDEVVDAILNHPVHAHDLLIAAGVSGEDVGASVGGGVANDIQCATLHTISGGVGTGGVQDLAAAQEHEDGANPLDHADHAAALAHVANAALAHVAGAVVGHLNGAAVAHLGADPIVAVPTVTFVDRDTVNLDVNFEVGDLLTLIYQEVGDRIPVS